MLIIFHNKADSDNNGFIISPAYSNSSDCSCNVWYCQIPLPGLTLPSLLCIIATQNGQNPSFVRGLFCFCLFHLSDICSGALKLPTHHTSEEICLISWVSRLSSAGIHVPIISSMRIIVLRNPGGIQSEKNLSDSHTMRGPRSLFPCVGSVCVTPNYNVTCIRVLTHVISGLGQLYDPFIRLISLFVSHAGLMLWKR